MKEIYFLFITIWFIQRLSCLNANAVQEDLTTFKSCIRHAIDLFNNFERRVCDNSTITDPEKLIPKECQPICQSMAVTPCNSKQSIISVRLNIYFPIVNSQPGVRCSDCHNIQEATIICNMDNLLLKKDCNECFNTKPMELTIEPTISLNYYTTTTELTTTKTIYATSASLKKETPQSTTTPMLCPGTESNENITSLKVSECNCQKNETVSSSSSLLKTDMPVQYVAAAVVVGIIIGMAFTVLGFFLRNRFLNVHPRKLKDEKHIHNPAYEETHQFSNSVSKASSSKDDEYSEISENNNDRKVVINSTRKTALREGNDNYDHLNDNFHAKSTDDGTYDHAEYQSNTHHQADPFNGGYAQTNPACVDSSYTEVTGEGFVMSNEDISTDPYFVLEEKPCN